MAKLEAVDFDPFNVNVVDKNSDPLEVALSAEGVTGKKADIARSIYQQESSSGKNTKTSNAGAVGGMQIIPATFNRMADKGWAIDNPEHNARAGVRYISTLYDKAGGDPELTAAGYYGGEGAIPKAKAGKAVSDPLNPKAPNTLEYGKQVASRLPKETKAAVSKGKLEEVDYDPFAQQPKKPAEYELQNPLSDEWTPVENLKENLPAFGKGLLSGAADIGSTLRMPIDTALDVISPNKQTLSGLITGQKPLSRYEARRNKLEDFAKDNSSPAFSAGRLTSNIAGTAGVGGAAGLGLKAASKTPQAAALADAIAASGLSKTAGTANNVIGGATNAALSSTLIDPSVESAGTGAVIGAALPIVGQASKVLRREANPSKATKIREFQDKGYRIPPQDAQAGFGSQILNAAGGKIKTEQKASVINQPVTNKLVAEALGIAEDTPISREILQDIRKKAGKDYEVAKQYGRITADAEFKKQIDDIASTFKVASEDFPELVGDDVAKLLKSVQKEEFSSSSAIDAIRLLRDKADKAYREGDKQLGRATKNASDALESMIGRHLENVGAPKEVIENYQKSRKLIAKTYTVDKALNAATGNVSAQKLGKELDKGTPLEGGLKTAAEFGKTFGKSAQDLPGVNPYSIIDAYSGGGLGAASALVPGASGVALPLAAGIASRPLARGLVLSKPYQKAFVKGKSGSSNVAKAVKKAAPATGAIAAAIND